MSLRGYGELQEILKLYIAAQSKGPGRGVIDGANTPQTEREDDCVGAKAAQSEESGDAIEPVIHLKCWASSAGPCCGRSLLRRKNGSVGMTPQWARV